jgi:hypothetical protein
MLHEIIILDRHGEKHPHLGVRKNNTTSLMRGLILNRVNGNRDQKWQFCRENGNATKLPLDRVKGFGGPPVGTECYVH